VVVGAMVLGVVGFVLTYAAGRSLRWLLSERPSIDWWERGAPKR